MSRQTETAAGFRRLARTAVVTITALMLVASAAATGVTAAPAADHGSPLDGGGVAGAAPDTKADNATTDADATARVTNHDYAMPGRERHKAQRSAAFDAVDGNPTVAALQDGSFAFAKDYRYAPDGGTVEIGTWHERRVEGDWRTGVEVTYAAGYRAEVDVGPDGDVQGVAVSAREPTTVTKQYSDAEQRVVAAALADGAVESALAGDDYYVSRVAAAESLGVDGCTDAACHVVTFQRVDSAATLHVEVVGSERVVGVERADWDAEPASPDVDASAHPAVDAGADGSSAAVTSPVEQNNWSVSFSNTASDGIRLRSTDHDGTQFLYQSQIPNVRLYYPDGTSFRQNLSSADLANGVELLNYSNGFVLEGTYYVGCTEAAWPVDGCNRYDIRWGFFDTGAFQPWLYVQGPGSSGHDGEPTYRVRWRFDTDVDGYGSDAIAEWLGSEWNNFTHEHHFSSADPMDPNGNELQVLDVDRGYRANLSAYSRDDADFYALRYEPVTESSPATLVDGENVYDNDTMVYYVASRTNCNPNSTCIPGGVWRVDS